jgi:very-short-patch-repair endonuclease
MVFRKHEQQSILRAKRLRGAMTNAEVLLWSRLRRDGMQGIRFRRQHPIGPYVADFACTSAMLVIEVDGETHHTPEQLLHDQRRHRYFMQRGWCELRIGNRDVYDNLEGVLEAIWREANRKRY